MSWQGALDGYGKLIEGKLVGWLGGLVKDSWAYNPFIGKVYDDIEEYVLRKGSRLASFSTFTTYQGYGGALDERILNMCVAVELYRHCILVHDDLVDRDEFRRGGKTFHRVYAQAYDERFGDSLAVFTGDALYALALQALLSSGFNGGKLVNVTEFMAEGYRKVNESQVLDLLFEYEQPSVNDWYVMASRRAASLFSMAMKAGAVLSDAPEEDLKVLDEAAVNIGYAFDIQDDIIDTFASEEQYGRAPGGDVAQGKKPLHLIYTLQRADDKGLETLRKAVGCKPIPVDRLEEIRVMIRESGALDAAKARSKAHAEKAKQLISQTRLSHEAKNLFTSLITYVEESLDWYK